ncbi:hypothetical protein PR003_g28185 [Phytophthora rubi]|uniref:Uncharacterized protein n=1 Tax=Phytophthora rubi TaxID=129364 RepID=A0A6A4C1R7_9STRA|nr:hypothetical protein PR003_g28185 [Phytophthora rubi]
MIFIAPKLSARQAFVIVSALLSAARGKKKRFLRTMHFLIANHYFRLRCPPARINTNNRVLVATIHFETDHLKLN